MKRIGQLTSRRVVDLVRERECGRAQASGAVEKLTDRVVTDLTGSCHLTSRASGMYRSCSAEGTPPMSSGIVELIQGHRHGHHRGLSVDVDCVCMLPGVLVLRCWRFWGAAHGLRRGEAPPGPWRVSPPLTTDDPDKGTRGLH